MGWPTMTMQAVSEVIDRAMRDPEFRRRLAADPAVALAGFDLTDEERSAFAVNTVAAEQLEERMSKSDLSAGIAAKTSSPLLRAPSETKR